MKSESYSLDQTREPYNTKRERPADTLNEKSKKLSSLFYDINKSKAAFGNESDLFTAAKQLDAAITRQDVKSFLEQQTTYALHKPVKTHFPRDSLRAYAPLQSTAIDLIDYSSNPDEGKKYVFILVCLYSRFLYAEPMHGKSAEDSLRAFKKILKKSQKYARISAVASDSGNEMKGIFKNYLYTHAIAQFYNTAGMWHESAVERAIKSIKTRIAKFQTYNNTSSWLDGLQPTIDNLNDQKKAILSGLTPRQALTLPTSETRAKVVNPREKIAEKKHKSKRFLFPLHTRVRITLDKNIGGLKKKGYSANYSKTIFRVTHLLRGRDVAAYKLAYDDDDVPITSIFYNEDLQKVT